MLQKPKQPPTLLAFLKAPRLGTVKTRLAASVGDALALNVYRYLGSSQLKRLPRNWSSEIHYTPIEALAEMQGWLGGKLSYQPQCEGDLGAKLRFAIEGAFDRGAESVICIGADCPTLDAARLEAARAELEAGCDVVFGPSDDGGYYLVGLQRPIPELFEDVPWSASNTLEASMAKAKQSGLRVALLPHAFDIDEEANLMRAIALGVLPKSIGGEAK